MLMIGSRQNKDSIRTVKFLFSITAHISDRLLIKQVQDFFDGIGHLFTLSSYIILRTESVKDTHIILNLFLTLFALKKAQYLDLWAKALKNVSLGEHLSPVGFSQIIKYKVSFKQGLSEKMS